MATTAYWFSDLEGKTTHLSTAATVGATHAVSGGISRGAAGLHAAATPYEALSLATAPAIGRLWEVELSGTVESFTFPFPGYVADHRKYIKYVDIAVPMTKYLCGLAYARFSSWYGYPIPYDLPTHIVTFPTNRNPFYETTGFNLIGQLLENGAENGAFGTIGSTPSPPFTAVDPAVSIAGYRPEHISTIRYLWLTGLSGARWIACLGSGIVPTNQITLVDQIFPTFDTADRRELLGPAFALFDAATGSIELDDFCYFPGVDLDPNMYKPITGQFHYEPRYNSAVPIITNPGPSVLRAVAKAYAYDTGAFDRAVYTAKLDEFVDGLNEALLAALPT